MQAKEYIKSKLLSAGASAIGFAKVQNVDDEFFDRYEKWIGRGSSKNVNYMLNYPDIRRNPELLLTGAKTIICSAWNYLPDKLRSNEKPQIARFAYCADYHKSLRKILKPVCKEFEDLFDCKTRICIDSAPIFERYWAKKSGIGFIGRNSCLIIPGHGSWHFLVEILIDIEIESDEPLEYSCLNCGKCIESCPTGALSDDGFVDTGKCLSALTLEKPGLASKGKNNPLAGCDICQAVCPHNATATPTTIEHLLPLQHIVDFDENELLNMTEEEFKQRFKDTSLYRPGLSGLILNLSKIER